MVQRLVIILNLVVSFASAAAAFVAVKRPSLLSGASRVSSAELFYARMYAARSLPFGLLAGLLPLRFGGVAVMWVLFTASAVQLLDVAIAIKQKAKGMIVGASIGTIVHALCGVALSRML